MAKSVRIDDVKRPDKVTPSSTSRPVLVTNRPTLKNDPMMAAEDVKEEEGSESVPMTHSPKVIAPISIGISSAEGTNDTDTPEAEAFTSAEENKADSDEASVASSADSEPKEVVLPSQEAISPDAEHDTEAAVNAEEVAAAEAKVRREQELENIIESGKYAVPIDAIRRRRSRIATTLLVLLAVALAFILFDVVADVGIVHIPSSVPHTHFFSKH